MPTPHPMTLAPEGTALLIVDIQERLFPSMDADHREEVMRNIKVLAATARRLRLPVLVTEQYPKGLGHTLPELRETLGPEIQAVPKVSFSCWAAVSAAHERADRPPVHTCNTLPARRPGTTPVRPPCFGGERIRR